MTINTASRFHFPFPLQQSGSGSGNPIKCRALDLIKKRDPAHGLVPLGCYADLTVHLHHIRTGKCVPEFKRLLNGRMAAQRGRLAIAPGGGSVVQRAATPTAAPAMAIPLPRFMRRTVRGEVRAVFAMQRISGSAWGSDRCMSARRTDRLWLINALAVVLLTLLGAAGEQLGYDRHLKTNRTKRRTHSLFRQGSMLCELMPNMTDFLLLPLIKQFAQMLAAQPLYAQMFGAV